MSDVLHRRYLATGGIAAKPTSGRPRHSIGTLVGYAARFNEVSHDLGGFRERILPGAFAEALRTADRPLLALHNHDDGDLLASTVAGTLRLKEDTIGLRFEIDLPDTTLGRDVMALARRGDLSGASFAFTIRKGSTTWEKTADGTPVSVVRKVAALREVSVVSSPAYPRSGITSIWEPAARPETPAQARCRAAVEKMRLAVAATR